MEAEGAGGRTARVIVAGVGNVLRRDDGFGVAVARRLTRLPPGAELMETGIGGVALLQELLVGCSGLIVVDALDRGAAPGTVFELVPHVGPPSPVPDMHLAEPGRVFAMAKGMGCLPRRLLVIGCQPADAEGLGEGLTPPVAAAVETAAELVRATLRRWLEPAPAGGPTVARRAP